MKGKKIKLLMVFVAILMLTTVISGCGSKKNDSSSNQGSTAPASSAGGSEAPAESAASLPPYELTMAFFTLGSQTEGIPEVEAAVNAIAKEKINTTVKFLPIAYGSWTQQTNLMLAGNEKLDLMIGGVTGNYATQVAQGQILPMNELIEKYGTNIKESLYPFIMDAVKVNGEIYGVPARRDFAGGRSLYMRKDIVDKYQIDLSKYKTFEDLTELFQIVKDNEPNMIPIVSPAPGSTPVDSMAATVFDGLVNKMGSVKVGGGDIVNMYETEEYAGMLKLVRSWYDKGFIRKDEATAKDSGQDLVKAGQAFSYISTWKPGNEGQESRKTGTEIVSILMSEPLTDSSHGTRFNWSIAKNSKNPERAMMFLDLMFGDKDINNLLSWGIEGRDYVKKSETTIGYPEGVDSSNVPYGLNMGWLFGDQFKSYVFETDPADLWDQMDKFNLNSTKSPAVGFNYDSSSVKNEVAAVTNVLNQYRIGLETGTLDPATVLPEFISKLKDAGIEDIIKDKQKQYDEWSQTKK